MWVLLPPSLHYTTSSSTTWPTAAASGFWAAAEQLHLILNIQSNLVCMPCVCLLKHHMATQPTAATSGFRAAAKQLHHQWLHLILELLITLLHAQRLLHTLHCDHLCNLACHHRSRWASPASV